MRHQKFSGLLNRPLSLSVGLLAALTGTMLLSAQEPPPAPTADSFSGSRTNGLSRDQVGWDDDGEAMLRGPVHEAFAEQYNPDPLPGMVIAARPPELVEELPPEVRPEGRDVEWISGYWAWDEDRENFMWVSGVWRDMPQGFRWLPGYWAEADGGYQWVSGTWISDQTAELQYLDTAPPETLEVGPSGVAPSAQHIWIPGCWNWYDTRYVWRPGYWSMGYSDWIWVPARYRWTPRGYFFCNGYWDYPLDRRGVLFAPWYFHRPIYARPGFFFTPRVVVASSMLQFHFWVRPRYHHYYFGDFYGAPYFGRGLMPWHQFHGRNRGFDPLFAHYSRLGGGNVFYTQINNQYNVFVNQADRRPPHTFRDQDRWAASLPNGNGRQRSLLGSPLQTYVENSTRGSGGPKFVRLESDQRERFRSETSQIRTLASQRREVETGRTGLVGRVNGDTGTDQLQRRGEGAGNDRGSRGNRGSGDDPAAGGGRTGGSERLNGGRNLRGEQTVGDGRTNGGGRSVGDAESRQRIQTGSDRTDRLTLPPVQRRSGAVADSSGSPAADGGRTVGKDRRSASPMGSADGSSDGRSSRDRSTTLLENLERMREGGTRGGSSEASRSSGSPGSSGLTRTSGGKARYGGDGGNASDVGSSPSATPRGGQSPSPGPRATPSAPSRSTPSSGGLSSGPSSRGGTSPSVSSPGSSRSGGVSSPSPRGESSSDGGRRGR